MPFNKTGPLSQDDLLELWKSAVDGGYSAPLLEQPDSGLPYITQGHAQLAALSSAVDRTFQSYFILPYSGQTNDPASGESFSSVEIVVQRSGLAKIPAGIPVVLQPGLFYDHAPNDFSDDGPIQVFTGRRYAGVAFSVIGPGELGPITLTAIAERAAAGYDLPLPGEICVLDQPGSSFSNDRASVVPGVGTNQLVLFDEPEVLTPDQIGQIILFTAGANVGRWARMIGYRASTPGDGGTALLAAELIGVLSGVSGQFIPGEVVENSSNNHAGVFVWTNGIYILIDWSLGTAAVPDTFTGTQSGATAVVSAIYSQPLLTAETGSASWRVLSWTDDLGLSVTNPASPSGGRVPVLDALGAEREILRSPGEADDDYRERVATPADVVSPNALVRAMNRVLVPLGLQGCLREVGTARLRGMFYDGDPNSSDPAEAFAYDLDFDLQPEQRYNLDLDYTEFRAFFLVGLPPLGVGEFGIAYDDHPLGFYDASPFNSFFDGFPAGAAQIYLNVYNNLATVKAGGVGFDLIQDTNSCLP